MNQYPQVGLIGCGNWGRNLARNFHALGALKVISTRSKQGRQNAETVAPGVEVVAEADALYGRADLDAVVLATPAETHHELTIKALTAGKDVFVEKPMALNPDQGREMVELAAARSRILMVGHLLEYHPAVAGLKNLISAGELGDLLHISSTRLKCGIIRCQENVLWSFAPHDIAMLLRLAGQLPEEVSCCGNRGMTEGVADVATVFLRFANGVTARITADWLFPLKERRLTVAGDQGMAVFDDCAQDKLVLHRHRIGKSSSTPVAVAGSAEVFPLDDEEPLRTECRHFLECIRDRRQPVSDGNSGLAVQQVLQASQESMEQGGAPVRLGQAAD